MTSITFDPYEGLDWSSIADPNNTGNPPRCQLHAHPRGTEITTPDNVIDLYTQNRSDREGNQVQEKYTIVTANVGRGLKQFWPWENLSEIDADWEDRDPEQLGVIAFPSNEVANRNHTQAWFWAGHDADIPWGGFPESIRGPLDRDHLGFPEPVTAFAHPSSYYDDLPKDGEPFRFNVEKRSREDGLIGTEVYGRRNSTPTDKRDVDVWDYLLQEFSSDNIVFGFSVDDADASSYEVGDAVDLGFVSVLLESEEFDPADQLEARSAAQACFKEGRLLSHKRDQWDPDAESPPAVPMVDSISVSDSEIQINATNYDEIRWYSGLKNQVHAGSEFDPSDAESRYVRAEIWTESEDAVTLTQPWGIDQS